MLDFEPFNVDICAAIISDKPPKLPLREELQSLGFEVIYRASGVGAKAAKNEAKKAVAEFRKNEQVKDLQKRRLFKKSSKRIKVKLDERRRIEHELRMPHALSYESYEQELYFKSDTASHSTGSVFSTATDSRAESRGRPSARRRWKFLRSKKLQKKSHYASESESEHENLFRDYEKGEFPSLESLIGEAAFQEFLSPFDPSDPEDEDLVDDSTKAEGVNDSKPKKSGPDETKKSVRVDVGESGFPDLLRPNKHEGQDSTCESRSGDPSSLTTEIKSTAEANIQVVVSSGVKKQLPTIQTASDEKTSTADSSKDHSSLSSKPEVIHDQKLVFVSSPSTQKYLPGLQTVVESESMPGLDDAVKTAFGSMDSEKSDLRKTKSEGSTPEADNVGKIAFGSPTRKSDNKTAKLDEEVKEAFQNLDIPLEGKPPDLGGEQKHASIGGTEPSKENPRRDYVSSDDSDAEAMGAWLTSARHAFQNIAAEVCRAAGLEGNPQHLATETSQDTLDSYLPQREYSFPQTNSPTRPHAAVANISSYGSISTLFEALESVDTKLDEIQQLLEGNEDFLQIKRHHDGRLPLHTICARGMPKRSLIGDFPDLLLDDISTFKGIIRVVERPYSDACSYQDKNGDLPVHLAARSLMEWEAVWYEAVYQRAAEESDPSGRTAYAITLLYKTMSECIEILLRPVAMRQDLCQIPGSIGSLLLLHIAAIYTVPVPILRKTLESYPEAAGFSCKLEDIDAIVPDGMIPLDLHEKLSTDFPKWEVEVHQANNPEVKWSQAEKGELRVEDCMRRSDLLFCYFPCDPYRFDPSRIHRLESRVIYEAKHIVQSGARHSLSVAAERIWIWFCCFEDQETKRAPYLGSVKRIVDSLDAFMLQRLSSVNTSGGRSLLDVCNPECSKVIRLRLDEISHSIASVPTSVSIAGVDPAARTRSTLHSWENAQSSRLIGGRHGFVASLCRQVFNVREQGFPTSFIILPYKLTRDIEGKLSMAKTESGALAVKFAECLLKLTDSRSILYFLESKSRRKSDSSLCDQRNEQTTAKRVEEKIKECEDALLNMYQPSEAYLYLIDEANGAPSISGELHDCYPIILSEPANIVRKLLPLMLVGMVLMRGDKAISVLCHLILDRSVQKVPPGWIEAANQINLFLSPENRDTEKPYDLLQMRHEIIKFVSDHADNLKQERSKDYYSEWNVELSILKMLLSINDTEKSYGGLKLVIGAHGTMLWTSSIETGPEVQISTLNKKHDEISKLYSSLRRSRSDSSLRVEDERSESEAEYENDNVRFQRRQLTSRDAQDDSQFRYQNDISSSSNGHHSNSEDSSYASSRKHLVSRYSILLQKFDTIREERDEEESRCAGSDFTERTQWNDSQRVYDDVNLQLDRAGAFLEDSGILELKVDLARQAKKLTELGKRVHEVEHACKVLTTPQPKVEVEELKFTRMKDMPRIRKLMLRMCDLEDRLLVDQIELQHVSLESYSLDRQIDELVDDDADSSKDCRRDANTTGVSRFINLRESKRRLEAARQLRHDKSKTDSQTAEISKNNAQASPISNARFGKRSQHRLFQRRMRGKMDARGRKDEGPPRNIVIQRTEEPELPSDEAWKAAGWVKYDEDTGHIEI